MSDSSDPQARDGTSETPARRERRWWRPRWTTVMLTLSILALTSSALVVINSPLMEINAVRVSGTRTISAEAVAQLAALRGANLLTANLEAARERILTQPVVRDVSVSRVWPNSVRIVVEERTPWASWEVNGEIWALDAEGVILDAAQAPEDSVLVRQVSSLPAIHAGARVDLAVVELIRRLEEAGAPAGAPRVLTFEWSLKDGLTVVTQHGRITFGGGDGFAYKYQVWEQLEFEAQRRGEPLLAADLRFGTRPAVDIGLGLGRATRIVEP